MASRARQVLLEGVVTDPNVRPLRAPRVTVTSPNLISPQTATTGDDGRYQIPALPPGSYKSRSMRRDLVSMKKRSRGQSGKNFQC